jgi:hypothetical protein
LVWGNSLPSFSSAGRMVQISRHDFLQCVAGLCSKGVLIQHPNGENRFYFHVTNLFIYLFIFFFFFFFFPSLLKGSPWVGRTLRWKKKSEEGSRTPSFSPFTGFWKH